MNSDGKITFSEFAEALSPKDRIYADNLMNKRSNYSARYPEDAFSYTTKLDLADLIRKMLRSES